MNHSGFGANENSITCVVDGFADSKNSRLPWLMALVEATMLFTISALGVRGILTTSL